jgi:two-component system nitrate/nitrite response regulator NarL
MRIFIGDGHTLFRAGLRRLLDKSGVGVVVGEAGDGLETLRQVAKSKPDMLVLDLVLARLGGLEVLQRVRTSQNMHTVLLTAEIGEKDISKALQLGVGGIILKGSPFDEFTKCIRCVNAGGTWIQQDAGRLANICSITESSNKKDWPFRISNREMEIIGAVAAGRRTKEIAKELSVSKETVKHHLTNIFNKTGVSNRLELVIFAIEKRLLDNCSPKNDKLSSHIA